MMPKKRTADAEGDYEDSARNDIKKSLRSDQCLRFRP